MNEHQYDTEHNVIDSVRIGSITNPNTIDFITMLIDESFVSFYMTNPRQIFDVTRRLISLFYFVICKFLEDELLDALGMFGLLLNVTKTEILIRNLCEDDSSQICFENMGGLLSDI